MSGLNAMGKRDRMVRWLFAVALLLAAWSLRWCQTGEVPPGWRDDELINVHTLSGEVLSGSFPLYFSGASGHEPLFHYVQAGVQAAVGVNVVGVHLLPASLGLLSIVLTYVLARRLFGWGVAAISALALTASFWSLMYSRIGLRHISVVPFALLSFLLLWRGHTEGGGRTRTYVWLGVTVGISMYTYFASRLLPIVLLGYLLYLFACRRKAYSRQWRGVCLAIVLALVIVAPMAFAIIGNVGSDPRIAELAAPLRSLRSGDPWPMINATLDTLRMFTTTGDPEWLYNVPGRPVFNMLGGLLLWVGVAACLARFCQPARFLVLWWFILGLAPAFASIPPASLSHTILAQPAAYILVAVAVEELGTLARKVLVRAGQKPTTASRIALALSGILATVLVASNAVRDTRDYFIVWPRESLVRFLYRADYRDSARYLDANLTITDVAVGSTLLGPWDGLALEADGRRQDVQIRLFDPDRALVWVNGGESLIVLTDYPRPGPPFDTLLSESASAARIGRSTSVHDLPEGADIERLACGVSGRALAIDEQFVNGLALQSICWLTDLYDEGLGQLVTVWRVAQSLDLPLTPVVANPPPPGVYSGPRLAVFAHLVLAGETPPVVDDGLWVDPSTLRSGDLFAQAHMFRVTERAQVKGAELEIGLYDPYTSERVALMAGGGSGGDDRIRVSLAELGQ